LGIIASVLFIVALVNGVNFTDGQNGLASGTVLVSMVTLMAVAWNLNDLSLVYISLVICASVLAFMIYNFPKGKIFLGDGGAYLLGFMIATLSIVLAQRHQTEVSPFIIPALLIYPLWEVVFSTLRKLFYDRISPFPFRRLSSAPVIIPEPGRRKRIYSRFVYTSGAGDYIFICSFVPEQRYGPWPDRTGLSECLLLDLFSGAEKRPAAE
jgi:UDP-N-acetylmuramyl pentapeptide phosphotransferase/UDP-N-acetylglucosamine-1-phosphate transferase